MNKHIRNYINSFKLGKDYVRTFLTDAITFILIFSSYSMFSLFMQKKAMEAVDGRTMEQVQKFMQNAAPEQLIPFLQDLKSFLFLFIFSIVIIVIAYILFYSLSRAVIWNHIIKKKLSRKKYWRWNLMNILLVMPLLLFGIIYLLIKLFVSFILNFTFNLFPVFVMTHSSYVEMVRVMVNGVVGFYAALLMTGIIFLIYYQFVQKYKVWESIGAGFKLLKVRFSRIWKAVLLATITASVFTLITLPLKKFIVHMPIATTIVNLIIASLFLAWLRLYILKTVGHGYS